MNSTVTQRPDPRPMRFFRVTCKFDNHKGRGLPPCSIVVFGEQEEPATEEAACVLAERAYGERPVQVRGWEELEFTEEHRFIQDSLALLSPGAHMRWHITDRAAEMMAERFGM